MTMTDDEERRAHLRYNVDAEVRIRPAGTIGDGLPCKIRDAGRGGVAVLTDEAPTSGRLHVEILNDDGQPIGEPLEAEVVYVEPQPGGRYRVGCRFEVPEELIPLDDD
jgi:hypothetical protein